MIPIPNLVRRGVAAPFCLLLAAASPGAVSSQSVPVDGPSVRVGSGVYEIVVHHETGDVFASTIGRSGMDEGRIYRLDGQTLAVTGIIPTPGYRPFGLGIREESGTLYATDTAEGAVLVLDIAEMAMVKAITNPDDGNGHLREVVADESTGMVYVSSYNENGMIWVIDDASRSLVNTYQGVGNGTSGMVLDGANNRLYAANMAGFDVTEIDLATGEYVRRFESGGERPTNLELDAERGRLWSANQASNDATVIDLATGELLGSVSVGDQGLGIRYNPANDLMYVTARRSGIVTAVDAASMQIVTWMQTGSHPNTVAVNRETGLAYVTNKSRSAGRDQPPVMDPNGDTVTLLRR